MIPGSLYGTHINQYWMNLESSNSVCGNKDESSIGAVHVGIE